MRVLVVAATGKELASVDTVSTGHTVDRLVTGVGMVATAVAVSRALASGTYDCALNIGVCGAFDPAVPLATVVHVVSDQFSELGVEDGAVFVPAHEMGLIPANDPPWTDGRLVNANFPDSATLSSVPGVRGITVNTVHGNEASIAALHTRLTPDVESMEGAAFMYACLSANVRFAQIRAVSNHVERRNRAAWRLDEAIAAVGAVVTAVIHEL